MILVFLPGVACDEHEGIGRSCTRGLHTVVCVCAGAWPVNDPRDQGAGTARDAAE